MTATHSTQSMFQYLQISPLSLATGSALGNALLAAAPKDAAPEINQCLEAIRSSLQPIQAGWISRQRTEATGERTEAVAADQRLDSAWGALRDNLAGLARLPGDKYPRAARAAAVHDSLFPAGTSFMKLPYDEEWAHSQTMLQRIDADGMAAGIDELVGPEFLGEIRDAHQHYGEVLGNTKDRPAQEEANFRHLLRVLAESMRLYAVRMIASVDPNRPETAAAAHHALEPIALHRQQSRRKSRGGATKPATTTPAEQIE